MKSLLSLLILCACSSIDAAATRLVMQSFRAPGIMPTSSRSLEIAKRWQHDSSPASKSEEVPQDVESMLTTHLARLHAHAMRVMPHEGHRPMYDGYDQSCELAIKLMHEFNATLNALNTHRLTRAKIEWLEYQQTMAEDLHRKSYGHQ